MQSQSAGRPSGETARENSFEQQIIPVVLAGLVSLFGFIVCVSVCGCLKIACKSIANGRSPRCAGIEPSGRRFARCGAFSRVAANLKEAAVGGVGRDGVEAIPDFIAQVYIWVEQPGDGFGADEAVRAARDAAADVFSDSLE